MDDKEAPPLEPAIDIEHVPCDDDPRKWSYVKKHVVLAMVTSASIGPLLAPSIYNPVIDQIKADLDASDTQIALSLSIYILFQGWFPIMWATASEVFGRKSIYILAYSFYTVATVIASRSTNMPTLIAMRAISAMGSAAVFPIGAGTLAEIFDPEERGRKASYCYGLCEVADRQLGFYYGTGLAGPAVGPFIGGLLGQRSPLYQKALNRALKDASRSSTTSLQHARPQQQPDVADVIVLGTLSISTMPHATQSVSPASSIPDVPNFKPSVRDANPLPTMWAIMKQHNNSLIILCSGCFFGAQYCLPYTTSLTLARLPYHYDALKIGLVLLSLGCGALLGSIFGGRASDMTLKRMKARNGGILIPEFRLRSVLPFLPILFASFLTYGWIANQHVHVAGLVICLFFAGLSLMLIYSSTLAYLVDANPGHSAGAVACNSAARGTIGCVLSQVVVYILNGIGDGGLYTIITAILAFASLGMVLVMKKGPKWGMTNRHTAQ